MLGRASSRFWVVLGMAASIGVLASHRALALQEEPPPPPTEGELAEREAKRLELQNEKRQALVQRHMEAARAYREALRYAEAEDELKRALELDPENLAALDLYNAVLEAQGKKALSAETVRLETEARYQLRAQQARAEAEENVALGEQALSEGNHDEAKSRFERVLMAVRWTPFEIEWGDLPVRAEEGLRRTEAERAARSEALREEVDHQIVEQLQAREEAEKQRRSEEIRLLATRAVEAFEEGNNDDAERLAQEILRRDPRNREARLLAADARAARHRQVRSDYVRTRREAYQRWLAELEESRIPFSGIFQPPTADAWERISSRRGTVATTLRSQESDLVRRARERLATERLPLLDLQDQEIDTIAQNFSTLLGLPVLVDPEVRDEVQSAGARVTLKLENVTLENALRNILTLLGPDTTYMFKHDALFITKEAKALGSPLAKFHDIRDLTVGITDFMGPKIEEIRLPTTGFEEEGENPFGAVGESPALISPEDLEALIRENISRETWDLPGFSIAVHGGGLIAVTTPEIHEQIDRFLGDLRRFASSVVTVETRFLTVTDAFLQELGVDFRGLGGGPGTLGTLANLDDVTNGLEDGASQGFDNSGTGDTGGNPSAGVFFNNGSNGDLRIHTENFFENPLGTILTPTGGASFQIAILDDTELNMVIRAVEKNADIEVLTEPVLTVFNTQRANLTVLNQVSFIQDFDVQVATSAFIADPSINVIQDGIVLDVRPTISYDRRFVTLELRPTVASLVQPIPTFTTGLGGLSQPVTFQLPELRISSAATTVVVPDGGSLLLGGLKTVQFVDRRATIPWLSKIPILSLLASQRGRSEEIKNLLVILRATITDLNDFRREADAQLAAAQ